MQNFSFQNFSIFVSQIFVSNFFSRQKFFSLQNFSYKFFLKSENDKKKILKTEKKGCREIDRMGASRTVDRKLAVPIEDSLRV